MATLEIYNLSIQALDGSDDPGPGQVFVRRFSIPALVSAVGLLQLQGFDGAVDENGWFKAFLTATLGRLLSLPWMVACFFEHGLLWRRRQQLEPMVSFAASDVNAAPSPPIAAAAAAADVLRSVEVPSCASLSANVQVDQVASQMEECFQELRDDDDEPVETARRVLPCGSHQTLSIGRRRTMQWTTLEMEFRTWYFRWNAKKMIHERIEDIFFRDHFLSCPLSGNERVEQPRADERFELLDHDQEHFSIQKGQQTRLGLRFKITLAK
eukprot:s1071_g14.t1